MGKKVSRKSAKTARRLRAVTEFRAGEKIARLLLFKRSNLQLYHGKDEGNCKSGRGPLLGRFPCVLKERFLFFEARITANRREMVRTTATGVMRFKGSRSSAGKQATLPVRRWAGRPLTGSARFWVGL